jgi:hypothetical protein
MVELMNTKKPSSADGPGRPNRTRFVDNSGHIESRHAKRLRKLSHRNADEGNARAFLNREATSDDDLAEALGEQAVETMTSGEHHRLSSNPIPEDIGGPFIERDASEILVDDDEELEPSPRAAPSEEAPTSARGAQTIKLPRTKS